MLVTIFWWQLALTAAISASPTTKWAVGQHVKTTSGLIEGHTSEWAGYADVHEFVGIPFAHKPVGPLRWMPPKPYISDLHYQAKTWVR
jgi:hypothetical protein